VVLLADAVAMDDDELAVGGDREAGGLGELLRGDRHGFDRAMAFLVPHRLAQHFLLLGRGQVTAFLLQLGEQLVEDRRLDDEVAVGRAARAEVRVFDSRVLRAASSMFASRR
jgi:hypothetical protein